MKMQSTVHDPGAIPRFIASSALAVMMLALAANSHASESISSVVINGRIGVEHIAETLIFMKEDFHAHATEFSSLRLSMSGAIARRTRFRIEMEGSTGQLSWAEVSTTTSFGEYSNVTFGQTKTVSLNNLMSGSAILFNERGAFNEVLGLGRQVALYAKSGGPGWIVSAAVAGDNLDHMDRGERSLSVRGVLVPSQQVGKVVHLGAWARKRTRETAIGYSFRDIFNADIAPSGGSFRPYADTTIALEGATIQGPVTAIGEMASVDADGPRGRRHALSAWYLSVGWLAGGGGRIYDHSQGRVGVPAGQDVASEPTMLGTVELAVRVDHVDFSSLVGGGGYTAWTIGPTWYAPWGLRVTANYTLLNDQDPLREVRTRLSKVHLRAEVDF